MQNLNCHGTPDSQTPLPGPQKTPQNPFIDLDDIIPDIERSPKIERKPTDINEMPGHDDEDIVIH